LNDIVEQDHRAIKRRIRQMMGFKDFRCARIILSGIETMHIIRKGQTGELGVTRTAADQFYSLVSWGILIVADSSRLTDVIATQP
jgi:putative transposase